MMFIRAAGLAARRSGLVLVSHSAFPNRRGMSGGLSGDIPFEYRTGGRLP
jgi:hypothetical protein